MKLIIDNNNCELDQDGIDIVYIILQYSGKLIIEDTTPKNYAVSEHENKIIIRRFYKDKGVLRNLFNYIGRLSISSCKIFDKRSKNTNIKIKNKRRKYITENIITNTEDLDIRTEEMEVKDRVPVKKTMLKIKTMDNLGPTKKLVFKDGTAYNGMIHYHLTGSKKYKYYSGAVYSEDSRQLYKIKPNNKIIKPRPSSDAHRNYLQIMEYVKKRAVKKSSKRSGNVY